MVSDLENSLLILKIESEEMLISFHKQGDLLNYYYDYEELEKESNILSELSHFQKQLQQQLEKLALIPLGDNTLAERAKNEVAGEYEHLKLVMIKLRSKWE